MSNRSDSDSALGGLILGWFGIASVGMAVLFPLLVFKRWGVRGLLLLSSVLATIMFRIVRETAPHVETVAPSFRTMGDAVDAFLAHASMWSWAWVLGVLYALTVATFLVGPSRSAAVLPAGAADAVATTSPREGTE